MQKDAAWEAYDDQDVIWYPALWIKAETDLSLFRDRESTLSHSHPTKVLFGQCRFHKHFLKWVRVANQVLLIRDAQLDRCIRQNHLTWIGKRIKDLNNKFRSFSAFKDSLSLQNVVITVVYLDNAVGPRHT